MSNLNGGVNVFGSAGTSTNSQGLSLSYLDQRYLDVAGGDKMLVNLDAGNNRIVNLTDPTLPTDATTKNYSDTKYLHVDDTNMMTGNLNMNNRRIYNLLDPSIIQDAATKNYVDTSVSNINTKKKQIIGLFPPIPYASPDNGWLASASSAFSASYSPNNVTLANGSEWATNGVTSNFWIAITIPSFMTGVEPYAFSVTGRLTDEYITSWRFEVGNGLGLYTPLYTSSSAIDSSFWYYPVTTSGVTYTNFRIYALTGSGINPGLLHYQVYYYL